MPSIHQLGEQSLICLFNKVIKNRKPTRLYDQLVKKEGRTGIMWRPITTPRTRSNFIEKGSYMWNKLDEDIKQTENLETFKRRVKEWVRNNIPIKLG